MAARTPGLRTDARRNRETLLEVAATVFAEQGTEASLRDVARRAGVGIGTLYRHFPTRDALLEAVLHDGLDALRAQAEESLDAESPGAALAAWLERFSAGAGGCQGVPGSVMGALQDERSELFAACSAMRTSVTRLLERAQEAGEVRPDVDADDLLTMAAAVGWVAEHGDRTRVARVLAVLNDGLGQGDPS
ncbi:TetR/AcrR family transcriptional regulator [Actinomadura rayongensis]|uniref:TetR family transcriptional regulator n=1 Tax=Actinomadura rayongensis TaxID=1429076 RepID=A0A6I4WAH0_9ACTN|nr:TetR/AcrR family transcriptional regulator [Actinomadura rayongensis]MXQ67197.1 TetR family transcriptional regulator [Actinomadura rayongensis]